MVLTVSVMAKSTVSPMPRLTLASATRPPRRMRLPAGICRSTTSLGVWKKTMVSRRANSTRNTATLRMPTAGCDHHAAALLACHDVELEPQAFGESGQLGHRLVVAAELLAGVGQRGARILVAAEHGIGIDEAQPAGKVLAVALEAPGEAVDHGGDHLGALVLGELLRGRHILRRRPARRVLVRAGEAAGQLGDALLEAGAPGRIGRSRGEDRLVLGQRVAELAVLLAGQRQPEARLGLAGLELEDLLIGEAGVLGDDAVGGEHGGLGKAAEALDASRP